MAAAKRSVLSSLAVYAEDSEPEPDSEAGGAGSQRGTGPEGKGGLVREGYGEDGFSKGDGEEDGDDDDGNTKQSDFSEVGKRDPQELVASFSGRVRNMSPDEIKIPPEPPGRCSSHLQDKIQKLYEWKIKEGVDMNYTIQRKKEFRNPSIYETLIQFCAIDELGTNYPKDTFDPHGWSEDSCYEALAKAQKIEMDKLEKAKKERTKIEFVTDAEVAEPLPETEAKVACSLGLSVGIIVGTVFLIKNQQVKEANFHRRGSRTGGEPFPGASGMGTPWDMKGQAREGAHTERALQVAAREGVPLPPAMLPLKANSPKASPSSPQWAHTEFPSSFTVVVLPCHSWPNKFPFLMLRGPQGLFPRERGSPPVLEPLQSGRAVGDLR
ncbi:UNVERIFIED_CONTAM: hypothetical protein K2H54_066486 [Gekko kuhli]